MIFYGILPRKKKCRIASPQTVLGSLVGCCTKDGDISWTVLGGSACVCVCADLVDTYIYVYNIYIYIYILLGGSAGVVDYWNAQC